MTNRIRSFLLALAVLVSMLPLTAPQTNAQSTLITDPSQVDGSDFTDSPALAEKLDTIFQGDAGIYRNSSCTNLVDTTLGTSSVKNNGIYMYVGPAGGDPLSIGTSCWIYANGVYHTLFGESAGGGIAGENSESLDLSNTANRRITYENFKAWGVRQGVGALIRASGHSMILLTYDADTLTILDGNGDGNGLVSISERTWDEFYSSVEYIVQPKELYYSGLYASGMCGEELSWSVDTAGTLTISGSGKLTHPAWRDHMDSIRKVIIRGDAIEIGNSAFHNCKNLEQVVFTGAAPVLSAQAFDGVTATVYYPVTGSGWSNDILLSYGGVLAWTPYGMTALKITAQPQVKNLHSGEVVTVSVAAEGDGLTYTWYAKDAGQSLYTQTEVSGADYCVKISDKTQNRELVCIVTDQYGNFQISENVLLQT